MNIIIFGPPGAGKGTQTKLLREKYGLKPIATGDMIRSEIASGSVLGREMKALIDRGRLVPDEIVIRMIDDLISPLADVDGFVLDGFPRTIPQAEAFDVMLAKRGRKVSHVIVLVVDEKILIDRIHKRAADAGPTRSDDNDETLIRRLRVYHAQTEPVLPYYADRGLIREIDGMLPIDEVTARIEGILKGESVQALQKKS
ncbi:MAG TPA: adenylate kinase [Alphaproteobacteria bacterium]|nr:adenylate kinase [Alphaproteobacteria bacterium]